MSDSPCILVATDVANDAELVRKLLSTEFDNVVASVNPDKAVTDFEKHRPQVLILAFDDLGKAERYYLGLYRLSTMIHALAHRTLTLCTKDDLRRVYELCRKEYFDDYILFWPMTHDAPRLPMAVHHALRHLRSTGAGAPTVEEFAAQSRRLAAMESLLEQYAARGNALLDTAARSLSQAQRDMPESAESLANRLTQGDLRHLVKIKDGRALQHEIDRLQALGSEVRLQGVAAAVQPVRDWAGEIKQCLAPQLESAMALRVLAERVRPMVLVVDHDESQGKLTRNLLADERVEMTFAASATQALASLSRRKPDLILMEVGLPDIDGVEVTRRIKSMQQFAAIPILMITAHSDKEIVVQSAKAGAAGFLVKPLRKEFLVPKVRSYLRAPENLTA
ncbi:MAG: response regulator [Betaproteobacteria bacterium]|nr:response regulator [Betaproteobacteria bacterium]